MSINRRKFLIGGALGATAVGAAASGLVPAAGAQSSFAVAGTPLGTVIDYASGPPTGAAVRAAGHLGAVRYVSERRPGAQWMTGKPLRAREVNDFRNNGITVVSVYQFGRAETADWHGGRGAADHHAPQGIRIHREAGGPSGVPIYVAIDDNPSRAQFDNQIAPYLERWRDHLAAAGMPLGIYANASTIDWCVLRGLGPYYWMHDWGSGGRLHPLAHMHQVGGRFRHVGGVESTVNDVFAYDFGQWWQPSVGIIGQIESHS